jgi:hypothetical protein
MRAPPRVTGSDTRQKMRPWSFNVVRPDGSTRPETFYARSKAEASKIARGWCTRMGYRLVGTA